MCGFISGLYILFHWSICLFLWQYHAVLITMTLSIVQFDDIIPPTLFFFFKIAVAAQGLFAKSTIFNVMTTLWGFYPPTRLPLLVTSPNTHFKGQAQGHVTCASGQLATYWRFQWPRPNQNANSKSRLLSDSWPTGYKSQFPTPPPGVQVIC